MRIREAVGIPVTGALHRKQARIVLVPFLYKHVERPFPTRHDRKVRRTKTQHGCAADLLEQILGAPDGIPELERRLLGYARVVPAVRRDLVARARDGADEVGLPLRQPAEHEERRARLVPTQELEQPSDLAADPGFKMLPCGPRHPGLERRDLEILLEVDRKVVGDHSSDRCNARARLGADAGRLARGGAREQTVAATPQFTAHD